MSATVHKRPSAQQDLVELAEYFAQTSPALSDRFLAAAEETFGRLAAMPGMGSPGNLDDARLADLRVWPVKRFKKYVIFYRPIPGGIEVLRVLHGARNLPAILKRE